LRHDQLAKIVHLKLATKSSSTGRDSPYGKHVVEAIIMYCFWNCSILTDKMIVHNHPHITCTDKVTDTTYLLDVAVPDKQPTEITDRKIKSINIWAVDVRTHGSR
jgi:hypothetical protein